MAFLQWHPQPLVLSGTGTLERLEPDVRQELRRLGAWVCFAEVADVWSLGEVYVSFCL